MASTIVKEEIDLFKKKSSIWWDENGEAKTLHTLNELRVPMVKEILTKSGIIKNEYQDTAHPLKGVKILDVGCGGGIYCEPLARLGATVTGIDPTEELITIAKSHSLLDLSLTNLNYILTTVEEHAETHLETYDCVLASEVLEHVTGHEVFLGACVKCLKPGGSLYITTFNRNLKSRIVGIWLTEYVFNVIPRGIHKYDLFTTPQDVTDVLQKYECITKEVKGMELNLFNSRWYWTNPTVHYGLHAIKNKYPDSTVHPLDIH